METTITDTDNVDYPAEQHLYVGYDVTQDTYTDNKLGFMFNLDMPSYLADQNPIVVQYVQYSTPDQYSYSGVTCTVDNSGDE